MQQPETQVGKGKGNGGNGGASALAGASIDRLAEYANQKTVNQEALIELECHQRSPLLMDAMPNQDVEDVLIRGIRKPIDRESPLDVMAQKKLYLGPNGEIGIRVEMLFACLRSAGRKVKVGKYAISSAKTTELPSILTIEDPFIALFNPATEAQLTVEDMVPDLRRGMMDNKGSKTAVGIVRPRFNLWGFKANVTVDYSGMDGLTEKHIYQLFEIAGRRIGLGSFNPIHNGPFGRFTIVHMNIVS